MRQVVYSLLALLSLALCFLAGRWSARIPSGPVEVRTVTETVYDTVRHFVPVARDSVVVRYVTRALPIAKANPADLKDSVAVVVPVESRVYEDSLYTAYVSGVEARLDSIFIRERHVLRTVTVSEKKLSRWGAGPYVGLGLTADGRFEPSVGVSVHYTLINF